MVKIKIPVVAYKKDDKYILSKKWFEKGETKKVSDISEFPYFHSYFLTVPKEMTDLEVAKMEKTIVFVEFEAKKEKKRKNFGSRLTYVYENVVVTLVSEVEDMPLFALEMMKKFSREDSYNLKNIGLCQDNTLDLRYMNNIRSESVIKLLEHLNEIKNSRNISLVLTQSIVDNLEEYVEAIQKYKVTVLSETHREANHLDFSNVSKEAFKKIQGSGVDKYSVWELYKHACKVKMFSLKELTEMLDKQFPFYDKDIIDESLVVLSYYKPLKEEMNDYLQFIYERMSKVRKEYKLYITENYLRELDFNLEYLEKSSLLDEKNLEVLSWFSSLSLSKVNPDILQNNLKQLSLPIIVTIVNSPQHFSDSIVEKSWEIVLDKLNEKGLDYFKENKIIVFENVNNQKLSGLFIQKYIKYIDLTQNYLHNSKNYARELTRKINPTLFILELQKEENDGLDLNKYLPFFNNLPNSFFLDYQNNIDSKLFLFLNDNLGFTEDEKEQFKQNNFVESSIFPELFEGIEDDYPEWL